MTTPVSQRLIEAALATAASRGWRRLALADVASAAGVGLAEAYAAYPSKAALLRAIVGLHDRAVLEGGPADAEETARDRLFEVVMRRFDSLQSHRAGMRAIVRDVVRDPLAMAALGPGLLRALVWMLEAAGLPPQGPAGPARVAGLGLVYLAALRAWSDDDSPDLARTMAALDRALREAEGVARRCPLAAGAAYTPPAADTTAGTATAHAPTASDTTASDTTASDKTGRDGVASAQR